MTEEINQSVPDSYFNIAKATKEKGFAMSSDILTCSLLQTLAASKPVGNFLELGTGTGLSLHGFLMESILTQPSFPLTMTKPFYRLLKHFLAMTGD